MPNPQQNERKMRVQNLAERIAKILHDDMERNGKLKPSPTSPKFWSVVQIELNKLKGDDE